MKFVNPIILFAALAACTPETTTPTTMDPPGGAPKPANPDPIALDQTSSHVNDSVGGFVNSAVAEGDTVPANLLGVNVSGLKRMELLDKNGFRVAANQISFGALKNTAIIIAGETSSGNLRTSIVALGGFTPPNDGAGALVYRFTDAELPQHGSATFEGSYAGIYDTSFISIIYGDATLTADFEDATINGVISNRQEITESGGPWTSYLDIVLEPSDITTTGSFNGVATGGAVNGSGTTTSGGTYIGLIGGATGNEVAGALEISTTFGTKNINETGVFLAEQTDP